MDNAPYHSQQINQAPTSANKKSEIQEWLREHGIEFSESELKPELLQKVFQILLFKVCNTFVFF